MKLAVALGSAVLLGLAGAYAQEQKPPADQNQPNRQQMPMGQGMMGGMGGGMMGGGMMEQMSRMMENCNKMMESHLQQRQQKSN
jgi:predicted lipid-binding transport protein (Tim44 family)